MNISHVHWLFAAYSRHVPEVSGTDSLHAARGFAAAYGMRLTSAAAWRWTCRLHQQADRTLGPFTAAVAALEAQGVPPGLPLGSEGRHRAILSRTPRRSAASQARAERRATGGIRGPVVSRKHVERLVCRWRSTPSEAWMPRPSCTVPDCGCGLSWPATGPRRSALQRRAVALPVTFLGFLARRADMARLLATADFMLVPGPHETFGLAALDCKHCARADWCYAWTPSSPAESEAPTGRLPRLARHKTVSG